MAAVGELSVYTKVANQYGGVRHNQQAVSQANRFLIQKILVLSSIQHTIIRALAKISFQGCGAVLGVWSLPIDQFVLVDLSRQLMD